MKSINIEDFIVKNKLPSSYKKVIQESFSPLAKDLVEQQRAKKKPIIIGINGAQGSGKTTLATLLVLLLNTEHSIHAVTLSIDDFYFSHSHRDYLAKTIHPLLITRGVPGTHDIALMLAIINSLTFNSGITRLPKFNKATDNPYPESQYPLIRSPVDIIIIEGWCMGAEGQSTSTLSQSINSLEQNEDTDSTWRNYINKQLMGEYHILFNRVDKWIMLKAPSFDCVFKWRLEQENKLRKQWDENLSLSHIHENQIMDDVSLKRFIMFYQRITEHVLKTLPAKVDYLFELDENRIVQNTH